MKKTRSRLFFPFFPSLFSPFFPSPSFLSSSSSFFLSFFSSNLFLAAALKANSLVATESAERRNRYAGSPLAIAVNFHRRRRPSGQPRSHSTGGRTATRPLYLSRIPLDSVPFPILTSICALEFFEVFFPLFAFHHVMRFVTRITR